MKQIRIACTSGHKLALENFVELQGELKDLSKDDYKKFRKEIIDTGFAFAPHVWQESAKTKKGKKGFKFWLVDGHQRIRTLREMVKEGFSCPDIPVVFVEAKSLKEAKRRVLQGTSQYGKISNQGLYEFMTGAEIDFDDLSESFRLPDIAMDKFGAEFFDAGDAEEELELYTKKIQAPIYEPKGDKPEVDSLIDISRMEALTKEIYASDLAENVKSFLVFSAMRHLVFNYEEIAEYYAHADKATQDLMEKSALVIIDFKKAIERGFVALAEELGAAYGET